MIHLANKIVVGLDLTAMDDIILDYLCTITDKSEVYPELLIVHNIKYELDDDVSDLLDQPLDVVIREELESKVNEHLPNYKGKHELMITQESSTIEAIADIVNNSGADLLVFGKKLSFEGTGLTTTRLLRQNLCSVLIVPENARLSLSKVILPIDFSKNSARVYRLGIELKEQRNVEVKVMHVYHIPQVYFPYIPVKPITTGMDKKARDEYKQFLTRNQLNKVALHCTFIDGKDKTIVKTIVQEARAEKADLIALGSKGESSFLGSVALGLANYEMKIPLLFVK